jgi:hypothetical protein
MSDLAEDGDTGHPLAPLPRTWWFPSIPGYRTDTRATYVRHNLDDQPRIEALDDQLSWLEADAEKPEWSIDHSDGGGPVRALTPAALDAVSRGLPLPASLRLLAQRRDLQRRIRSATACYLDLGDFRTPTTANGGYLIHLLSDQQWCRHWLLYLDTAGNEAVATSTEPIGFDLPDDWPPLPQPVPADGSTVNLEVCADSFAEFLYRFWIENEVWYALHEGRASTQEAASYAAQLSPASRPETLF